MLPMARDETCPTCGRKECCKCHTVGWIANDNPTDMRDQWKRCGHCGRQSLVQIEGLSPKVYFCGFFRRVTITRMN